MSNEERDKLENMGDVMTMIFLHEFYLSRIVASTPENPESDEEYEKHRQSYGNCWGCFGSGPAFVWKMFQTMIWKKEHW